MVSGRTTHCPTCAGHVLADKAHRAGQWRTPTGLEGLALAADVWMLGAADATLAASSTTLVYWSGRAPPHNGRPQLLNLAKRRTTPNLGNKMIPVCPPPTESAKKCTDAEPNYERFPQTLTPPTPRSSADDCFALRFSLLSESAAIALE